MSKKINELKHTRAGLITEAEKLIAVGQKEDFDAKMKEVESLNSEISGLEAIEIEKGRFNKTDEEKVSISDVMKNQKESEEQERSVDSIRSSKEYARAFAKAIKNHAQPNTAFGEDYKPLQAALTEAGGTPEGADGGFLVPIDIDNQIRELRRSMISLVDLVQVENVTAPTGWRVKDTAPEKGFTKLEGELSDVSADDQPKFAKVNYALDTYGLYIPMSRQLVDDEVANLMSYLARWFAKKSVITENLIILAELNKLTAKAVAAGEEIKAIKEALNVTLDPAISLSANVLTNQSGFNLLDQLEDAKERPLMQPDVTDPTQYRITGRPITVASDAILGNVETAMPFYIGDLAQYMTFFRRQALEVATTDVGGDAWRKYGLEIRGIMRCGSAVFDDEAAVKLNIESVEGA